MLLAARMRKPDVKTATQAVDFVYANLVDVSRIQIFFPIIVGYVFWNRIESWKIVLWCICSCLVYAARMLLVYAYKKKSEDTSNPYMWGDLFTATGMVSGLLWGYAAWLFYIPDAGSALMLLYVLIVGTAAGAVMISSFWITGYLAYAIPSVALTAVSLFVYGDLNERITGFLLFLLLVMLIGVAFKSRAQGYAAIRLRFENLDLVERLAEEKNRAEDANRAKTKFLASANHDLRQPVHALSLLSFALRDELNSDHGKAVYSQLDQTVSNLNNLLESLLDLSQLESGAVKIQNSYIDLVEISEQLKSEFLSLCNQKGLSFNVRSVNKTVKTDHTLLMRLLRNILSNAVRYTEHGRILLSFRVQGDQVAIQVWDTGVGINPVDQDNVFREFYQACDKSRKSEEGLGLGLSICQKISSLLDLKIDLSSTPGKGTVFTVWVPLASRPVSMVNPDPQTTAHTDNVDLSGQHILVIDDDLIGLSALSGVLTLFGAETTLAQSSQRAMELASEMATIDLIISDFRLSEDANGIDLIRELRVFKSDQSIPALIVTGDTEASVLEKISSSGIDYVHKPVRASVLAVKLRELLTGIRAESLQPTDSSSTRQQDREKLLIEPGL